MSLPASNAEVHTSNDKTIISVPHHQAVEHHAHMPMRVALKLQYQARWISLNCRVHMWQRCSSHHLKESKTAETAVRQADTIMPGKLASKA